MNAAKPFNDHRGSTACGESELLRSDGPGAGPATVGLAIEVIGRVGSVAVAREDRVSWCCHLSRQPTSSAAAIGPAVHHAWHHEAGAKVDYIAVADGPGSFTGLRIAMTMAKSLAFAAGVPIVLVDSLAAITASLAPTDTSGVPEDASPAGASTAGASTAPSVPSGPGWVAIAAYRGQVFATRLDGGAGPLPMEHAARHGSHATQLYSAARWREILRDTFGGAWCAGDRSVFQPPPASLTAPAGSPARAPARAPAPVQSGSEPPPWPALDRFIESPAPRAVGVARIGAALFADRQTTDAISAAPRYFRPSAAEEKAASANPSEPRKR